jgi:signal transduction histidine kinase/DNA-binding NarL/FixJ family response regulator
MTPVHLLLVEDSEDDALLVIRSLRQGALDLTFERVETAEAMREAIRTRQPDLIISDGKLPMFDAHEALHVLQDTGMDIPFILVSGQIGEETAATLMRSGAQDFVLKDNLARLVPAVRREVKEAQERRKSREVQAELRSTEERFRLVAEHLHDVVFRCRLSPSIRLEYISPSVTAVTGIPVADLYQDVGKLIQTVEPDDQRRLRDAWASATPQLHVLRWQQPTGTTAWIEQRTMPVYDERNRLVAVEGILRNITDQVNADEARRDLEHRLRQAERLDSLGQLTGGIAHDFNNLLGVIQGYANLALDTLSDDHPCRPDIEGIDRAAVQGAALTRQLLIFSRLQPSQPETLDVNAVVNDSVHLLRRTIGEDITFVTTLQPDLEPVTIDRSRLEQIILNAIVNSRAAMPEGGTLTIQTATAEEDGTWREPDLPAGRFVRLSIEDTGHGMTPDVAQRAFEPFYSTKGPGEGTGLGLATVYGAVKEACGTVTLWSEPDGGTRLTVYLPSSDEPVALVPDEIVSAPRGDGIHVLVVDDNHEVGDIARRILTTAGYRATLATSREDGLAAARATPVALILADLTMPGMTAHDFFAAVWHTTPDVPILLMSGYPSEEAGGGHSPLPPDLPLISKPFDTARLLQQVHSCLHSPRRSSA